MSDPYFTGTVGLVVRDERRCPLTSGRPGSSSTWPLADRQQAGSRATKRDAHTALDDAETPGPVSGGCGCSDPGCCRGRGGGECPGAAGRQLLAGLLGRLTDAHIRALFEAGRIDQLGEPAEWRDPATKQAYTGIDAWVAVFKHKRKEIADARCGT